MRSIMRAKAIAVLFILMPMFSVHAANISVLVVEVGADGAAGAASGKGAAGVSVRQSVTERWESGMMDVFFEAGHIVSNGRSFQMPEKVIRDDFKKTFAADLDEAREGGADYLVLATLDYSRAKKPSAMPHDITVSVFSLHTHRFLFEESAAINANLSLAEEFARAKKIAWRSLLYLGDAL
jgi:hypothetical protein